MAPQEFPKAKTLQELAEAKARSAALYMQSDLNVSHAKAFDPMLILAIVSIIIQVAKMMGWCGFTPTQAVDKLRNPGIVENVVLSRVTSGVVREKFGGRPDLTALEVKIKKAIKATAARSTEDEIGLLLAKEN